MKNSVRHQSRTGRTTRNILLNEGTNYVLEEADRRGHGNRSRGAGFGAAAGAILGSFLGVPGAAIGGLIGGGIGGAIGASMD